MCLKLVLALRRGRIDDFIKEEKGGGSIDRREAEKIALIAAEKAALLVYKGIVNELNEIRERIEGMMRELRELKNAIEKGQQPRGRPRRGVGGAGDLIEVLQTEGYILASEAKTKLGIGPNRLRLLAAEAGAEILEAEGDYAVVSRQALEEFKGLLASTRTSDASEAARRMGRYERLFRMLRMSGRLFYDPRAGWRIL